MSESNLTERNSEGLENDDAEHGELSEVGAQRYCSDCDMWIGIDNWKNHNCTEMYDFIDPDRPERKRKVQRRIEAKRDPEELLAQEPCGAPQKTPFEVTGIISEPMNDRATAAKVSPNLGVYEAETPKKAAKQAINDDANLKYDSYRVASKSSITIVRRSDCKIISQTDTGFESYNSSNNNSNSNSSNEEPDNEVTENPGGLSSRLIKAVVRFFSK